jgi:hypothetical protein
MLLFEKAIRMERSFVISAVIILCSLAKSAPANTYRMAENRFPCTRDEQGWIDSIPSRDGQCQSFHPSYV